MLSKEGASELRNLQSQGVKASFPGLGLGMLFSGMGASCSGVFVTCVTPQKGTHISCSRCLWDGFALIMERGERARLEIGRGGRPAHGG